MTFEVTFAQMGKITTIKESSKSLKKSKVSKVFDSWVVSVNAYNRLQALAVAEIIFRDEIMKDEVSEDAERLDPKSETR